MNLYIDKDNLISFIRAGNENENDDGYRDCERLISRQLGLTFNFPKEEIKQDELIMTWMKKLSEGRGFKDVEDKYSSKIFPERPVKSNCYNDFTEKQLSAVYLINDVKTQLLIDKKVLLIGNVGQEVEILKKLFCGNDYDLDKLYDIQNNLSSWEKLEEDKHFLPCTDIIIMDNYLFSVQHSLFEFNIYKLLSLLTSKAEGKKVNIVIFTHKEFTFNDNKTKQYYTPDFDRIKKDIIDLVKKQTSVSPNLTIVYSNKKNKEKKHDRFILTNYRLFRSGDSFCYFDSKGKKITRGDFLDVNSLAKWSNHQAALSILTSTQELYDEIKKNNPDSITGINSKSNFIKL